MNPADFRRKLTSDATAVAMTEFALGMPLLLVASLWGIETANLALANLRVGQLAVQIADNASRIGDTSTLQNRKIYESDINDLIYGAQVQGGTGLDLFGRGRVIISSLEADPTTGRQYIHWQRCRGLKAVSSSYGVAGDGTSNTITGMGPPGEQVSAQPGDAVIFVEVIYDYRPLIAGRLISNQTTIRTISSFTVRDDRDLGQIYQRDPAKPDPVQDCATFSGAPQVSASGIS